MTTSMLGGRQTHTSFTFYPKSNKIIVIHQSPRDLANHMWLVTYTGVVDMRLCCVFFLEMSGLPL